MNILERRMQISMINKSPKEDYNDGYYHIKVNVFKETIEGQYLGTEENPDGIDDLNDLKESRATIYNLAGQRLSKPQHGLNIIGGRKVLIR